VRNDDRRKNLPERDRRSGYGGAAPGDRTACRSLLAILWLGIETEHFRDVHRLPPDLLADLGTTLPVRLDPAEIRRAVRATAAFFFREARS